MESDGWLEHTLLGYNCRLSELSCALGLSQLSKIESILQKRAALAHFYCETLQGNKHVITPPASISDGRISWFAFVVRLEGRYTRADRDRVIEVLDAAGIGARAYFPPIHLQPLYAAYAPAAGSLPITEETGARTLALPFFNALTRENVLQVGKALQSAFPQHI